MFKTLSHSQQEIVFNKSGKFVVRACPGSGKTYCVGARLARLIHEWDKKYEGIAALSFTNVAWQEIEKKCSENFGIDKIEYPHYIGTIDSFVNKYIFLPHGHLVLKCQGRPTLIGEPHGIWNGGNYDRDPKKHFDICSYDINGNLIPMGNIQDFGFSWNNNKDGSKNGNVVNLENAKKSLLQNGYATQSDANYFAMKILEQYPNIVKAIVARFPFLIVDEAQDTSDIQMRIIDLLIENGMTEVMLVGDPDQAIFEWNDARPELLTQKFDAWGNSVILNESRRSSQHICDFTFGISSLNEAAISVNERVREFQYHPKVITYNDNIPQIVSDFIAECQQHGGNVSKETIAVIFRSAGLVNDIFGLPRNKPGISVWTDSHTREFSRGKYLYDNGRVKDGFKIIERVLLRKLFNLSYCSENDIDKTIDRMGFIQYKSQIYKFINLLPGTDISIGDWVNQANAVIAKTKCQFTLGITQDAQALQLASYFSTIPNKWRIQTSDTELYTA